ncbi:right-handed parallel beta-helix repeat-containing protein [Paenibacillus oryzisoli]|uniref:right-handed parallel beta-helix repeat-containing protein n=1 Tax=Paenibacillus oryzisoli TaxID=1850517 RepID=UPI003D2E2894
MKRLAARCLLWLGLLSVTGGMAAIPAALAGTQATYYASPTGSGTTCSLASPCSLSGVRDKVRTVNTAMTGDIIVELRGGTYALSSPLVLNGSDSGTNGYKVIWRKYASEAPVLSGGQSLSGGWTLHDAASNIYKKTGVTANFRQLVVDDLPAIRARIPNRTNADNLGPYYDTISADTSAKTFKINKSEIAAWSNLSQVEMVVQPHWYHNNLRVNTYTTDTSYAYVSFQAAESGYGFTKAASYYTSDAYHFENAYEMLDAEGEWYLNTGTDTLYYKPRSGESMSTASVLAPQTDTLLDLQGTSSSPIHHVEFNGLTFTNTGWNGPSQSGLVATQAVRPINGITVPAAIQSAYGNNLRWIGNTWTNTGANGLQLRIGVTDSQIVGNGFSAIAANAIVLDDSGVKSPSAADQTSRILVANNTISRVGQQYTNGMGIVAYFIKDSIIENNTISYGPYMGMQIGGQAGCNCDVGMGNNEIRYNNIHHMMQLHDDGGGIYTLARQSGTRVLENYVHDMAKSSYAMSSPVAGIYLDNYSEYITVQHNVITGIGTGAQATYEQTGVGAKNNTWTNNGTTDASIISSAGVQTGYTESMIPSGTILLNETFDSYTTGAAPTGWTTVATGGTVTTAGVPTASDKSLSISKPGSANVATAEKSFTAVSGVITLEAKVRAEQTAGWKMVPYVRDSAGNIAVSIVFENGSIKTYDGTTLLSLQPFTAGIWYNVKAVMNTSTDTFDLYVNGSLLKKGAAMRSAVANLASVSTGIGTGHTGAFYIDNMAVTQP